MFIDRQCASRSTLIPDETIVPPLPIATNPFNRSMPDSQQKTTKHPSEFGSSFGHASPWEDARPFEYFCETPQSLIALSVQSAHTKKISIRLGVVARYDTAILVSMTLTKITVGGVAGIRPCDECVANPGISSLRSTSSASSVSSDRSS